MMRTLTRRARMAYYLAWLPMSALVAVVLNLRGHPWWEALLLGTPMCTLYALVCGSSYYMARAMPLRRTRMLQVLLSLVGASAAAGGAWAGLVHAVAGLLPQAPGERLMTQTGLLAGMGCAFFLLSLVYHYLILALEETRRAERRSDEARVLTREAELRALRAQVNPHFLFNSLNSIAALIKAKPDQARRMCQLLSDFLRSTLRQGDLASVPLGEELDLVRNYLEIERVRFSDRMTVEEHIDDGCLATAFPPLALQPLVENAVKHGVSDLTAGGRIDLDVMRDRDLVIVRVVNPRDPHSKPKPGSGRGLSIVEARLRTFYGDGAQMVVHKGADSFRVELKIPVQETS